MAPTWHTYVYRTDLEAEEFTGLFLDDADANKWVGKQKEGTYEVSSERPGARSARLAAGNKAEEAPDE
jgi:hypothetical protein